MVRFPIKALSRSQLDMESGPVSVPGGQAEVSYHIIYDVERYVSATTTNLLFFNTARANRSLTNFGGRGQFPEPQYFKPYSLMVDFFVQPSDTAFADMHSMIYGTNAAADGGPFINLIYADKEYGPWPLSQAHGTGGVQGFSYGPAAAAVVGYANNGPADGGIWLGGNTVTFAPNQQFRVTIEYNGPVTLAGDLNVKVSMAGTWFRRVA